MASGLSGELRFVTTWLLGCSEGCECVCVLIWECFSSAYLVPGLMGTWHLPSTTSLLAPVPSVASRYLNGHLLGEGGGCQLAKIQISGPPPAQSV